MPLFLVICIKINKNSKNCTGADKFNCDFCELDRLKIDNRCICPNKSYEDS